MNFNKTAFPWEPHQTEWLDALESGEYPQARERLRIADSFCCLGLLLHLRDENRWASDYDETADMTHWWWEADHLDATGEDDGSVLPDGEWQRMKLRDCNGLIDQSRLSPDYRDSFNEMLASMNDEGMSFADIAGFIRANPYAVFTNAEEKDDG